jgi:hypothetical protein
MKMLATLVTGFLVLMSSVAGAAPKTPQDLLKPISALSTIVETGGKFGFLRTSLLSYASQWGFVFTVNRGLGQDIRASNFDRWLKNVTTLPEIPDGDSWITNFIGHPLMGASIYAFYRDRGFSHRESVAGAFLQSTLFEYTVEGWKKPPSGVDLIVTPLVGSFIGSRIGMKSFLFSSSYAVGKYIFQLF